MERAAEHRRAVALALVLQVRQTAWEAELALRSAAVPARALQMVQEQRAARRKAAWALVPELVRQTALEPVRALQMAVAQELAV